MKKTILFKTVRLVVVLLLIITISFIYFEISVSKAVVKKGEWNNYSLVKLEKAKRENIPVLIYFKADWCSYCLDFEKKVMKNSKTKKNLENYFLIEVDRSNRKNLYTKTIKKAYKVIYLPTVLIIKNNIQEEIPIKIEIEFFNSFIN